jgi:hypothetical protein
MSGHGQTEFNEVRRYSGLLSKTKTGFAIRLGFGKTSGAYTKKNSRIIDVRIARQRLPFSRSQWLSVVRVDELSGLMSVGSSGMQALTILTFFAPAVLTQETSPRLTWRIGTR